MLSVLWGRRGLLALLTLLFVPVTAFAQNNIAGVVRDSSGGVLPGVTVEAASPALIEKVRSVVTNDDGLYQIVDLRPGSYTVTFTLPGFSTVKREGIVLTGSQTATLNADMRVGVLEETITVTGESPVVDVQTVSQRRALTADVIDALPSARNFQSLATLIPGVIANAQNTPSSQDVGGLAGERQRLRIHGGRFGDMVQMIDGLSFASFSNNGAGTHINVNPAEVQEFTYELSSNSAENMTGGVRMNVVPKDGGNNYRGYFFANFTNASLQSSNITDELRARGLRAPNSIQRLTDVNPAVGGPLKADKLWFFTSFRYNDFLEYTGGYKDTNPSDRVFTPATEQTAADNYGHGTGLRLTYQANQKNKVTFFGSYQDRCTCASGTPTASWQSIADGITRGIYLAQVSWNSPMTNRILLEAGVQRIRIGDANRAKEGVTEDMIRVQEQSTGVVWGSAVEYRLQIHHVNNARAAMSYVTGSHAMKVGFDLKYGDNDWFRSVNGDIQYRVNNGIPNRVTLFTTPYEEHYKQNAALGLFVQDRWTVHRFTINGGVRFDYHNASVPATSLPPTRYVPARSYAEVPDVPNWTDLSPRLGVAFDLFGTGKTAIKASLNRYVANESVILAQAVSPVRGQVLSATRTWTDGNNDFIPQENELGVLSNPGFGLPTVVTQYDKSVTEGFGNRGFNWETAVGIQHELMPGMAVDGQYVRRRYGNFLTTDNLAVAISDYDSFCVTTPPDPRLPGGGGQQICGLYDLSVAARARVPNNIVTLASNYGEQSENWSGIDLNLTARLPRGALVSGGFSTGKTTFDRCDVVGKTDTPAIEPANDGNVWAVAGPSALYCHQETRATYAKFLGTTRLPWDVEFSATLQNVPGPEIRAQWEAPNAAIVPSLGRNLSAGATATATVELVAPGTMFAKRVTQIDLRVGKIIRMGRTQLKGMVDLYNALNTSRVLVQNNVYGPAWQQPTYIIPGRLVKFGAQLDF